MIHLRNARSRSAAPLKWKWAHLHRADGICTGIDLKRVKLAMDLNCGRESAETKLVAQMSLLVTCSFVGGNKNRMISRENRKTRFQFGFIVRISILFGFWSGIRSQLRGNIFHDVVYEFSSQIG